MIEAAAWPDPLTLVRTVLVSVAFLYVPGRLFLKGNLDRIANDGLDQVIESVFLSILCLAAIGIALAFTIGIHLYSLLGAYALLGIFLWTRRKS